MSFSPVTVGGFTITSAEFVKAAVNLKGLPKERLPQVAFLGRSNVGKSSLLNTLMGQKTSMDVWFTNAVYLTCQRSSRQRSWCYIRPS